ncbi:MFS general substrate transporter [Trichoderma evansii]
MSQTNEICLTRLSGSELPSPADTIYTAPVEATAGIEVTPILPVEGPAHVLSKERTITIIATLSAVSFLSSISTGLLTIGLPRMAVEIGLPDYLIAWPSSVYTLASGSSLIIAGSIADVVGNRVVNTTGCFLVGCFIIACGVGRTGIELIMFRAFQGVALSLCLPTSVAIVASITTSGRQRNIGFSCLGFVQPIGFSLGLVLGGVLLDTIGWRVGWYICGALTIVLFFITLWALPVDKKAEGSVLLRLRRDVDWIGAILSSASLALISYVLGVMSSGVHSITIPANIAALTVGVLLIPSFVLWQRRQEKREKPTLIPNSLWKNRTFTTVCLLVIFSYAVVNAMEFFCSLFFQNVQQLSALQASLRILPSLIVGALVQVSTGLLIHRIPAFYLLLVSMILSAGAPLLMATISVHQPYWFNAFFAQLVSPISADILFTVGLLVVSDVFPARMQALAGAVFNTVAQFGTSIGLTIMAVIAAATTNGSKLQDKNSPDALMSGYRASFWAAFTWMGLACFIGACGLRKIGMVGLKRD